MDVKKGVIVSLIVVLIFISFLDVTLSNDVELKDDQIESDHSTNYPFKDHYPTIDEYYIWFENISRNNPDLVNKITIGKSWEGRDLIVLKISDNVDEDEDEPEVLIDGGIHAREWSSPQAASYLIWTLVNNYDSNETIHWLVSNREIFVMPLLNPDGYFYDGNGYLQNKNHWRKNRNDSISSSVPGVDLNRNWGFKWDLGNNTPESLVYHGESPFSEPETKNYCDWILTRNIESYASLHSYGGMILCPWDHTHDSSPHVSWFKPTLEHMVSFTSRLGVEDLKYYYEGEMGESFYLAYGTSTDWVYKNIRAQSYCIELATGYDKFYPKEDLIMVINEDIIEALIYQVRIADTDLGTGYMDKDPEIPFILYGSVENITDRETEIKTTNLDTGEIMTTTSDSNGYFEFNFANFEDEGYSQYDEFKIQIGEKVEKEILINDGWGMEVDFDVENDNWDVEAANNTYMYLILAITLILIIIFLISRYKKRD